MIGDLSVTFLSFFVPEKLPVESGLSGSEVDCLFVVLCI